jgi:hypothetical protein
VQPKKIAGNVIQSSKTMLALTIEQVSSRRAVSSSSSTRCPRAFQPSDITGDFSVLGVRAVAVAADLSSWRAPRKQSPLI